MTKPLDTLLQKEVTRREFLTLSGFGIASIFGFGTIVKLLTGHHDGFSLAKHSVGYGSSPYGGSREA